MIAAILTNSPSSSAVRQLTEAGELRGHEMVTIDYRIHVGNFFDRGVHSTSPKQWFSKFNAIFAWLDLKDLPC